VCVGMGVKSGDTGEGIGGCYFTFVAPPEGADGRPWQRRKGDNDGGRTWRATRLPHGRRWAPGGQAGVQLISYATLPLAGRH